MPYMILSADALRKRRYIKTIDWDDEERRNGLEDEVNVSDFLGAMTRGLPTLRVFVPFQG